MKTIKRENVFCEILEVFRLNLGQILSEKWFCPTFVILTARNINFSVKLKRFWHVNSTKSKKKVILWACHDSCCDFLEELYQFPDGWGNFQSKFRHFDELFSIKSMLVRNAFKKLRRGWLHKSKKISGWPIKNIKYRIYSVFCGHKSSMVSCLRHPIIFRKVEI